jgi:hypothetical protein
VTAISAFALMTAAASAQTASLAPGVHPATVTADTMVARGSEFNCRRAWRCGPYDCGWRRICVQANARPYWENRRYFWRRHQWRQHYW